METAAQLRGRHGYTSVAILAIAIWWIKPSDSSLTLPRQGTANSAPRITQHPLPEIAFRPGEDVTVPCVADADMTITYWWTKNGQRLNSTSSAKYDLRQGQGSIVIKSPSSDDDGVYQCFARTDYGTAISIRTTLKAAELESFRTVLEPREHRPRVGQSLTLNCDHPKSYPPGRIYWGVSPLGATSTKLEAIDNDNRVILDYIGRLHFANVLASDSRNGSESNLMYVCVVNNKVLGKFVTGDHQKVSPFPVPEASIPNLAPQVMWTSPMRDKAIKGQNKRLKCIFSGRPTPRVTWRRLDGELSSRFNYTAEGFGTEIEIPKVEYADAGRYECKGANSQGEVSSVLSLDVQSAPYWNQHKLPMDIEVTEDDPVGIECQVHGSPRPVIEWYIDGTPINDVASDPRRRVNENNITYSSVTIRTDFHVFQCVATNEHGQILANIALKIQASPPSFLLAPTDVRVVQGHEVTLSCRSAGAPKPVISWAGPLYEHESHDRRFIPHRNGSLEIKGVVAEDAGRYECNIRNKFGSDSASATLIVRQPTIITKSPQDLVVNVTDDVKLQCGVMTDPAEASNLNVAWRKNSEPIDYPGDRRLFIDPIDFSLTIKTAEIDDTAVYTCHANNGLDEAASNAGVLTVKGPPEAPTDVHLFCLVRSSSITWRAAPDNNDPLIKYIVFYNRTSDVTSHVTEAASVNAPARPEEAPVEFSASVALHPGATFTIYVVAVNSMGVGAPGQASMTCSTPPTTPSRNPSGVCSKLHSPRQLVITWVALPLEERNGDGFHYRVGYRRRDESTSRPFEVKTVGDANMTELVVHDQENFRQFEIYVQSANDLGAVPLSATDKRIGYSGEGKPSVIPRNLRLAEKTLSSTYVELTWDPVDTSQDQINGFFRGYRIEFWRMSQPEDKRTEDIILNAHFNPCPPLPDAHRRKRREERQRVSGSTNRLWPNSRIRAGVMALNQANYGYLSDTVEFQTPEGVPGRVARLEVTEAGSNHLRVHWSPPVDENGIITAYILIYQIAPPHTGQSKRLTFEPSKLRTKLLDLAPSTLYDISLMAATKIGEGDIAFTSGRTLNQADPSKPEIGSVVAGDNYANVTWIPTGSDVPGNPGSKFYVECRSKDRDDSGEHLWNQTEAVTDDNSATVTGLTPGRTYEVRVVSVNGFVENERETRSDVRSIYIPTEGERIPKPAHDEQQETGYGGWWFIVLSAIIILMLIILFIACLVSRSRGQVYPVYEKERLWGHPHTNEEQPFGEYAREDPPLRSTSELRKSRESLESDQKPLESDSSDSLGDYDDADQTKFNEDGSFIGAYNRNKTAAAPGTIGSTGPATALDDRGPRQHRNSPGNAQANTYV